MQNEDKQEYTIIKKSELKANSLYDYKKITCNKEEFVDCKIEEEQEEIKIYFEVEKLKAFTEIRKETKKDILAVLIDVSRLANLAHNFKFELSPSNLFYDINFRVKIKMRDILDEDSFDSESFLREYKALIAYSLQKKYSYEDYIDTGLEIMKKHAELRAIYLAENASEILEILTEYYNRIKNEIINNMKLVKKNTVRKIKTYAVFATIFCVFSIIGISYLIFDIINVDRSVIKANNMYMEMNYVGSIEALRDIPIDKLEVHSKYILATAYIKSENLSTQQKENILGKLQINSDEKIMNYWIAIGRLDTLEAINLSMQLSDDELLLYAYLKEKFLIENDTVITGEEKIDKLKQIETKIEEISKKYETEE